MEVNLEEEAKKFLDAEETANNILESLKKLRAESAHYQTAKDDLETVRQQLVNLINSTEKVAKGSHEVVQILKEIGGPEILDRIVKLENKSNAYFEEQSKTLKKLKTLIIFCLTSSLIAVIIGISVFLK